MSETNYAGIFKDGLWNNNTGLVALLGLCPLLAVSNTVVNGVSLGIATILVLGICNLLISLIRRWTRPEIRVGIYVIIIAATVTAVGQLMQAFLPGLYATLGLFIALITTNCAVLGRAEAFAAKNKPLPALADGLAVGLGFTAVLVVLGAIREILGSGTLFAQADLLLGEWGNVLLIHVVDDYNGFLLALLPPGAFFALALLVAAKNAIDRHLKARAQTRLQSPKPTPPATITETAGTA
jgi:Na+-translocating ferredoxin:NAD+ oxidoreductase subunit E